MKCISIKQPWAWLIANGYKPIENRSWVTKHRGPLLLHAGKSFDKSGYEWVKKHFPDIPLPEPNEFERGGFVGKSYLANVIDNSLSKWAAFGMYNWILQDAEPLPFVECKGKLRIFEEPTCRVCGCTSYKACPGGCHWIEYNLCSRCKPREEITKAFETPLNNGSLTEVQIEKAKFACKDVLKHTASEEQIKDMYGFIVYCRNNKNDFPGGDAENYISLNITHDIYEFFNNGNEDWFSPRTSGYRKYLNP